jgi:uncharacterized membrane protein YdjX (TVP38/TMEM64 family)
LIAGGVIFGPLAGTLLSLLAATLASSASFSPAGWAASCCLNTSGDFSGH